MHTFAIKQLFKVEQEANYKPIRNETGFLSDRETKSRLSPSPFSNLFSD